MLLKQLYVIERLTSIERYVVQRKKKCHSPKLWTLLNSIGTEDTYSTDYVAVFEVCGEKVSIEDEQLARALKAIEERKRNIVLQYFFIGDTDTYIGKMLDCSRANVTKCRIQALDKLKQLIEEEKEKCQKS